MRLLQIKAIDREIECGDTKHKYDAICYMQTCMVFI